MFSLGTGRHRHIIRAIMDKNTKDMLVDVIENLAGLEKEVGDLSAALAALRLTLAEMGADFESRYAKHLAAPEVQQVIRASAAAHDVLLQTARTLRGQS